MRQREIPGLPKSVVGWIFNHARKNFWRVSSWYEIDDLIQDGIVCAYKCLDRYGRPGIDIDEPHFMRLVQTTFFNHIAEMLRHSRAIDEINIQDISMERNESDILDGILGNTSVSEQDFTVLIKELPDKLRRVVELLLTDDGAKELRRSLRVRFGGENETFSDRLYKLTGFPKNEDFESELRSYIWELSSGLI